MSTRTLTRIIATTDVHSNLAKPDSFLAHLQELRKTSLVVDCGDFFEGTGYYRLGKGQPEREILTTLYDVLAPGNHGWVHYREPGLREKTVCCNVIDANDSKPLFNRLRIVVVHGRKVAVTAVIGPSAFHTIAAGQRAGHQVLEPASALRALMLEHHHHVDAWMVLSHSGFDEDLALAAACPFVSVIFSGHCHSSSYGPIRVGDTLVLKGAELGLGYAATEPVGSGWSARSTTFPDSLPIPAELIPLKDKIASLRRMLDVPLGTVHEPYRNRELDRHHLLREIADRLHTGLGAEAVILNETAMRSVYLGNVLTRGDLLTAEPFDNHLVNVFFPDARTVHPDRLLAQLADQLGPLAVAPQPLPDEICSVLTTTYLADTYLGGRIHPAGLTLGQAVLHTVAAPLTVQEEASR